MNNFFKYIKYILISLGIVVLFVLSFIFYNKNDVKEDKTIKNDEIVMKKEETKKEEKIEDVFLYVDVKGEVNNPGVYKLKENSRIIDAINEAGGLKENANTYYLNLSKKIKDEMCIIIYNNSDIDNIKDEYQIKKEQIIAKIDEKVKLKDSTNDALIEKYENDIKKEEPYEISEKVNINNATKEELLTVSGIGESKANSIIKYREENGNFESIEDIKKVSGIGDSLFEKIKEYITT